MKRLENILKALEQRVNETVNDELYGISKPVRVGGTGAWIEEYDLDYRSAKKFTVCTDSKNRLEHPNVEKYLSEELARRIPDLGGLVAEAKEESRREMEDIRATERSICRSYGWSY